MPDPSSSSEHDAPDDVRTKWQRALDEWDAHHRKALDAYYADEQKLGREAERSLGKHQPPR